MGHVRLSSNAAFSLETAASTMQAAYIAAAPQSVQPFLVPRGAVQQEEEAHAARLASHCCAVTLTLRLALQEKFDERSKR